ncbi:hypothetical protein [Bradyrhizobium sp. 76]|uniref:hypothetical protein n=1 Tax=Bradyrhizobium sp. 76 TaxID=2782680 RepID=UPI001FF83D51|nr:hypothetical protein [Bradyrhizobium sp. 76]MCK1409304.1 hypothetical protein [Bradyrhizobium sp. 76]
MEDIVEPVPCPLAFSQEGTSAICSRAALLMVLGLLLAPPGREVLDDLLETAPFGIPNINPLSGYSRRQLDDIYRQFSRRGGLQGAIRDTVARLYREDREEDPQYLALKLLALHLADENEMLRVAATVSWLDIAFSGERYSDFDFPAQFATLLNAARKPANDVTRAMAMTALSRMWHYSDNQSTRLYRFLEANRQDQQTFWLSIGDFIRRIRWRRPAESGRRQATIVHGTVFAFAKSPIDKWWRPRTGDLHVYLETQLPQRHLYSRSDYFRWSGGWSDYARSIARDELLQWVHSHRFEGGDVFAHSHGANVLILATDKEKFGKIVLLSCPVHHHLPIRFENVKRVVSIRVKWDFVIMADRARQRFSDPRIREVILPIWFGRHQTTRQSSTWRDQNLMKYL